LLQYMAANQTGATYNKRYRHFLLLTNTMKHY
jgi:hypothetical protein